MNPVDMNLNDSVMVELTDEGLEWAMRMSDGYGKIVSDGPLTRWKGLLWEFMHVFGPVMYNGSHQQFYGNRVVLFPGSA